MEVKADKPMDFIFGTGYLLPKFEENILNKEVGDSFEFVLSPSEGYGETSSDANHRTSKGYVYEVLN